MIGRVAGLAIAIFFVAGGSRAQTPEPVGPFHPLYYLVRDADLAEALLDPSVQVRFVV